MAWVSWSKPENINIGKDGTIGIDGFALLLNRQLIYSVEELDDFLDETSNCSAEIVFIQSKTSSKFESKEIENFGSAVEDFISEEPRYKWSKYALEKIALFNKLIERSSELLHNPNCYLYYVSLGRNEEDQNNIVKTDVIKERVLSENVFHKVSIALYGATDIQLTYKKLEKQFLNLLNFQIELLSLLFIMFKKRILV